MAQRSQRLFASLTMQQVRECLVHCEIRLAREGEIVFRQNDYTDSVFSILLGEVGLRTDPGDPREIATLNAGQFFGEMGLISGRGRAVTATAQTRSLLLEIDRRAIVRLMRSVPAVKREIEAATMIRHIKAYLAPNADDAGLAEIVRTAALAEFGPNEVLIREGGTSDHVYIVRKGSVTVSRQIDASEIVIDYLSAGSCVGEMAMLRQSPSLSTVKAANATDAIRIDGVAMRALLATSPRLRRDIEERLFLRLTDEHRRQPNVRASGLIEFLLRQGVGEASNVLLIDEALCVHCDNCEKACAETHYGVGRLMRDAGPTHDGVHLPMACRHCEHPSCTADCPTDAIGRTQDGAIVIADSCNGCGNCERNCPYGAIQMVALPPPRKSGLLMRLLFGERNEPREDASPEAMVKGAGRKHAVKCDLCAAIDGGPACVRACPTGAAIRVKPEAFIAAALQRGRA